MTFERLQTRLHLNESKIESSYTIPDFCLVKIIAKTKKDNLTNLTFEFLIEELSDYNEEFLIAKCEAYGIKAKYLWLEFQAKFSVNPTPLWIEEFSQENSEALKNRIEFHTTNSPNDIGILINQFTTGFPEPRLSPDLQSAVQAIIEAVYQPIMDNAAGDEDKNNLKKEISKDVAKLQNFIAEDIHELQKRISEKSHMEIENEEINSLKEKISKSIEYMKGPVWEYLKEAKNKILEQLNELKPAAAPSETSRLRM